MIVPDPPPDTIMEPSGENCTDLMPSGSAFSWDDVQCTGTDDPYGASKFAVDATAVGLSGRLQKSGVSTALVCPGYVLTQMTRGYSWFVMLAVCA